MAAIMIQGTSSGSGKTILVAALCRIFSNLGYKVSPFKSQNMSNLAIKHHGLYISQAQALQAIAARTDISPDLNPILLQPRANNTSRIILLGKLYKTMKINDYYNKFVLKRGLDTAVSSLNKLLNQNDLVILEGAGSPAEINLTRYDIANMKMASRAKASVILISDIERGGSFASIAGTVSLLSKKHQNLVSGVIMNKFRGDPDILKSGFVKLQKIIKKPVLGVIPMLNMRLPDEDSLDSTNPILFNQKNLKFMNTEIDKMSKIIHQSIDIKKIQDMIT